ncbi:uncharacterized protein CC84DRAFT_67439 [Paraphaeosphaeria sporulosa]|uniref:Uncharacterized protein n=1 Tax=Paraphaeosphaeria sporulosa TaxID=1460663 RepID=A0A177CY33_9PLEO|nr:uncharacterized protein CC84DRAFT_67439 [Paraphaeosphaeria sporulosa]OAG12111.1 hypothetical protein CC84DRAFT_67439 [Paraphaeosphaeria sporulosa]
MRVLTALVSAVPLAGSTFALAIPDVGVANLASANEVSLDNYTCGYAYDERDLPGLGNYIRLPAWEVVTYNIKACFVSPECGCRFWNDEKAVIAGSRAEAPDIPEGDMKYAGCWHDGHNGHLDVKRFRGQWDRGQRNPNQETGSQACRWIFSRGSPVLGIAVRTGPATGDLGAATRKSYVPALSHQSWTSLEMLLSQLRSPQVKTPSTAAMPTLSPASTAPAAPPCNPPDQNWRRSPKP